MQYFDTLYCHICFWAIALKLLSGADMFLQLGRVLENSCMGHSQFYRNGWDVTILGPISWRWVNLNPTMDKKSHA